MRSLLSAVLVLSLAGCLEGTLDTSSSTQSVVIDNRIAANRIAANRIAANRIAANRIAANRIAANRLTLSTAADDLINTADGREVLTYIVSCAIPDGTTLVGTDSNNVEYEFLGEIGLAPGWLDHPPTEADKGWISACLFARVNAFDVAVPVSLRGPSSALATTADERAEWSVQEGAFYGMYFLPPELPIAWFACSGSAVAEAALAQRVCAAPDPANPGLTQCGFNYAGDCGDYAPPRNLTACLEFSHDGYYVDCATRPEFGRVYFPFPGPGGHHAWDGHDDYGHSWGDRDRDNDHDYNPHEHEELVFQQVITTFTQP